MTRRKLRRFDGDRRSFVAVFERYGSKTGWTGRAEKTLLFKDVCFSGTNEILTHHLWFTATKGFLALGDLKSNDRVAFDARVKQYKKGYWGHDELRQLEAPPGYDYKLSHPTKISVLKNKEVVK